MNNQYQRSSDINISKKRSLEKEQKGFVGFRKKS